MAVNRVRGLGEREVVRLPSIGKHATTLKKVIEGEFIIPSGHYVFT